MGVARFSNRMGIEARRALTRFRNTGPLGLSSMALRAVRLHLLEPERPRPQARPERIVVTLSTIPARARALAPVLRSLIDQSVGADRILLALPRRSRDGKLAYPAPAEIELPAGVDIVTCMDEGPATKFLPALKLEPEAVLIVVDDDVIYPYRFIETLLAAHRLRKKAAIGFRGACLRDSVPFAALDHVFATGVEKATKVDVLFGTWGYLLPPHALGGAVHDFEGYPEEVRWVDDIWLSGHLARAGVLRYVTPADGLPIETPASFRAALTRGVNKSGRNDELAIRLFASDWQKPPASRQTREMVQENR